MLLLKHPLCKHITGGGMASTMLNSPFWNSLDDQRGWDRERCNLYCLPAAVEWFYCKIDSTDHLISSLIYHSSQSADSLSVWESDFKVPSTTQEMALQTFQCLVMAGLIAGISEVDQWPSDKAVLRTVSLSAMQNSADQRRKSIWHGAVLVVARTGFCSVSPRRRGNCWTLEDFKMLWYKRKERTRQYWWGGGISASWRKHAGRINLFFMSFNVMQKWNSDAAEQGCSCRLNVKQPG